jgi:hypothetical protein
MQLGFRSPRRRHHGGRGQWSRTMRRALTLVGIALALVAPPTASDAATSHHAVGTHAATSSLGSQLQAGATLEGGSRLTSPNGRYRLDMQADGNLVLYGGGYPLWASNTAHHAGDHATMQDDGNFVIYQSGRAIWSSATSRSGSGAYYLSVQNDGNVVIYTPRKRPIWQTYTPIGTGLQYGDSGPGVLLLQRDLASLGYWLGIPDGTFGDSTQQAVYALQKAAGVTPDGVVGAQTVAALARGVVPKPRPAPGYLIEVNLADDLLMVVNNGKLLHTLNTSTGGGYTYVDQGVTSVAITPSGVFHIFATIDGLDVDSLGELWRPRFFEGGYAIHGDSYVPPFPVSHGCVRVSNEAIDWIWSANIMPIGTEVWVF